MTNFDFKAGSIDEIQFEVTAKRPLGDWVTVAKALKNNENESVSELGFSIQDMVNKARKALGQEGT